MALEQNKKWTTQDLLKATNGELICGEKTLSFEGLSIDSRTISTKDLYVAIKGETHDGHKFIQDVIKLGSRGIIADRKNLAPFSIDKWKHHGIVCIAVDDTTIALGHIASYHRKKIEVSVAAITGSNGKTTTREMMAAVVSRHFNTLSTKKNFNNNIGLPLTLLELNSDHQWAVVELGMNAPGEIEYLANICIPDIGVITNIGPAHLQGVGSIEGVMRAKGEILGGIKPLGLAILNADDHRVLKLAGQSPVDVVLYGFSEPAQIRARDIMATESGSSFILVTPEEEISVNLKIPGIFMVSNALAAAAVGYKIGLKAVDTKAGLEKFAPVQGRMNIIHTKSEIHIIDDTYNANPGSMKAALDTLRALKKESPSHFVIGDMFELGDHAKALHEEIGACASRSGISHLYATGNFASTVTSGAKNEKMNPKNLFTGTKEEILEDLKDRLRPGDWVLVKGSRAMGMEKIVEGLKEWAKEKHS